MFPQHMATMLVAALLSTICSVAGAPMFFGDGSILDSSVNELNRVVESHSTPTSAVAHQPEYDRDRFQPPANAYGYAHLEAWPHSHATPQYYAGTHTRSNIPQSSQPNQPEASSSGQAVGGATYDDMLDVDELLAPANTYGYATHDDMLDVDELFAQIGATEQERRGRSHPMPSSHSRSPSLEPGQRQGHGSRAGVNPVAFKTFFDNHVAGTHPSMGAQGSLLPVSSSSSSLHQQARSSSLPGESSAGRARARRGPPALEVPTLTKEDQQRFRKSAKQKEPYRAQKLRAAEEAASIGTDRPAIARDDTESRAANEFRDVTNEELLERAASLFTLEMAARQPTLKAGQGRFRTVDAPGYVSATAEQVRVIKEIFDRRLDQFKQPDDRNRHIRLDSGPTNVPDKTKLLKDFELLPESAVEPTAFAPIEIRYALHAHRRYLYDFVLGDYRIHVRGWGTGRGRGVYAIPRVQKKQVDSNIIFLGYLSTDQESNKLRP